MTTRPSHIVFGVVGLALGVFGVWALREATLSTHGRIDPSTQIELVIRARTEGGERGQSLDEMVEALLLTCRLEVTADIAGPIRRRGQRTVPRRARAEPRPNGPPPATRLSRGLDDRSPVGRRRRVRDSACDEQPPCVAAMNRSAPATPSTASTSPATTSDAQWTPNQTRLMATSTAIVHTLTVTTHHTSRRFVYSATTSGNTPQLAAVASG